MASTKHTRIGYDAKRIVHNRTGLGSYGRNLINDLSALETNYDFMLFTPDKGADDLRSQVIERENVSFLWPEKLRFRWQRDWWRTHGVVDQLVKENIQLFHGLSGELPQGLKRAGVKSIVTIHDLIFLRHPEFYPWLDAQIYKYKFYKTLNEADRIVAISECTKKDILYYSNFPENRIDLVYQSCDTRFKRRMMPEELQEVRMRYQLPAHYLLNVGTVEKRKNVLLAIKALHHLPETQQLVIVGRCTNYQKEIEKELNKGLRHRVHFLQGVPNDDLFAIYQMAECFVYPSRYEGFGIPIIEAIQSGLPVVAATGSCLEEAGGPDCFYVSPDDEEELAHAVVQAIAEKTIRVPKARNYVTRFENSNVARQMLTIYKKM